MENIVIRDPLPKSKKQLTHTERIMTVVTILAYVGLAVAHFNQRREIFGWCVVVILLSFGLYWVFKAWKGTSFLLERFVILLVFKIPLSLLSMFLAYKTIENVLV